MTEPAIPAVSKAITDAKRAHAKFKRAESTYEAALLERREAFRAALADGATFRGLASEMGLSVAMIQKVVKDRC